VAGVEHREGRHAPYGHEHHARGVNRTASAAVCEAPDDWNHDGVEDVCNEHQAQDGGGVHLQLGGHVGDGEGHHHVVHDVLAKAQAHRGEHAAWVALEDFAYAVSGSGILLQLGLGFLEDGCIRNPSADIVA